MVFHPLFVPRSLAAVSNPALLQLLPKGRKSFVSCVS